MRLDCKILGKRESNKLGRRQAIIDIATRSFLEQGYAGTSMSAIATDLGGSKSTLWGYFPSKEDLFEAVLEYATAEFRAQLDDVLAHDGAFADTIEVFCQSFITKISTPEGCGLHRLVIAECGRFPEVGRLFSDRVRQPVSQLLEQYFEVQIAEGEMRPCEPARAAITLVSLCLGDLHQRNMLQGFIANPAVVKCEAEAVTADFLRAYATG